MSKKRNTNNDSQVPDVPPLTFRCFQGDADYLLMWAIMTESDRADQIHDTLSLDDIRNWCVPSTRFDPYRNLLFALSHHAGGEPSVIGFSRVVWYTGLEDTRVYVQVSFLHPDWREREVWPAMVQQNERRLREIAASHPLTHRRFYQAWATRTQVKWKSVLESEGYQAVRHFNNMLHRLNDFPNRALPAGLEVRPVQPEHYRSIWEAQREVQMELFEVVAENWTEERYGAWLANPSHTPQLWQVAWDGEQVAGMVLNRIDEAENKQLGRKRGYTEHVFVRRAWRKRGLASALLARSLQLLKAQGMEEAELGVDTENESGAYELYKRLGYQTFSTDVWYRKPMRRGVNAMSPKREFTNEEARRIGNALGVQWGKVSIEEFRAGLAVELEHGAHDPETNVTNDDELMTGKIALAHLKEYPDYYTRLAQLEQDAEEFWSRRR